MLSDNGSLLKRKVINISTLRLLDDKAVKYREALLLVLFFLTTGPGPALFMLNKFTVTFFPLFMLVVTLFLYRKELAGLDFNQILRNNGQYRLILKAVQWGIYAHALSAILFRHTGSSITDHLLKNYPIMSINIVFIGPVIEEIIYRHLVFGYLSRKTNNFWMAAILSSCLFSLAHFSVDRFIAYLGVGLIQCYVYKKSGNLFPCMVTHIALNFISVMVTTMNA